MAQFLFLSLENPASSASSIAFNSQEYQKSTDEEVSFEYSYDRISSTNLKVRTALHVSVIDSGSESVDAKLEQTSMTFNTNLKPLYTVEPLVSNHVKCKAKVVA